MLERGCDDARERFDVAQACCGICHDHKKPRLKVEVDDARGEEWHLCCKVLNQVPGAVKEDWRMKHDG